MTKEASARFEGEGEEKEDHPTSARDLKKPRKDPKESFETPPLFDVVCTYVGYAVLFIFGHLADFWRRIGLKKDGGNAAAKDVSIAHGGPPRMVFVTWYLLYRSCVGCSHHGNFI